MQMAAGEVEQRCVDFAQIFLLDVKEQDRSLADGQMWKEDTQWAAILQEGWDLGRVKQAQPWFSSFDPERVPPSTADSVSPESVCSQKVLAHLCADARRSLMQVAGEVVGAVGSDYVQWLDDGSEHPHRIALSVQQSKVHEVSERLKEGFLRRDVQVLCPGFLQLQLCRNVCPLLKYPSQQQQQQLLVSDDG